MKVQLSISLILLASVVFCVFEENVETEPCPLGWTKKQDKCEISVKLKNEEDCVEKGGLIEERRSMSISPDKQEDNVVKFCVIYLHNTNLDDIGFNSSTTTPEGNNESSQSDENN